MDIKIHKTLSDVYTNNHITLHKSESTTHSTVTYFFRHNLFIRKSILYIPIHFYPTTKQAFVGASRTYLSGQGYIYLLSTRHGRYTYVYLRTGTRVTGSRRESTAKTTHHTYTRNKIKKTTHTQVCRKHVDLQIRQRCWGFRSRRNAQGGGHVCHVRLKYGVMFVQKIRGLGLTALGLQVTRCNSDRRRL